MLIHESISYLSKRVHTLFCHNLCKQCQLSTVQHTPGLSSVVVRALSHRARTNGRGIDALWIGTPDIS